MTLLQSTPKKHDLAKIRQQRSLVRGVNLRTNAQVLSPASFATRKAYMVQAYQEGKFLAEPELRGKPRPNPMSDPAAMEGMMGMMKGQMTMMIPQTLIMGWINAFFSGFVISKSIFFMNIHGGSKESGSQLFPEEIKSAGTAFVWRSAFADIPAFVDQMSGCCVASRFAWLYWSSSFMYALLARAKRAARLLSASAYSEIRQLPSCKSKY
jgi:hypothetical protein